MLTIILVLFVFSVLILIHEAGHLIVAKRLGVKVEAFSLGFGKRLCGVEIGGTDYRLSLFPFGGYVKMAGEDPQEATGAEGELSSKSPGKRFWIIAAGSLTNYIFAFILFCIIFMVGVPTLSNQVGQVLQNYPAEKAGIKVGDTILSISGTKVEYWDDIVSGIKEKTKTDPTLSFEISRDGVIKLINVKPEISTVKNIFGQTISRPMVGIAPASKVLSVSYNPAQAVYQGGRHLAELTAMTYKAIWLLLTGGMPLKSSVSGPIGIAYLMGQAARLGIVPLLIITAQVSMALAIFNLLPFPILDGGHVIFLGLEKLRGRPVSVKVQEIIIQIALVILIVFALFVSWQDIMKFTPLGRKDAKPVTEEPVIPEK